MDVPHSAVDSHRKTGPLGTTSHEAHKVALQKTFGGSQVTREGDTSSQIAPPVPKMVAGGKQCFQGQPLHPLKHALQLFTDTSKGWGAHLNDHTARGTWSLPESKLQIGR